PHDRPTPHSAPPAAQQRPWWKDAVVYQIYPRSFADADGNGIGDLVGITSRVPYLKELGVDAVWLSPFYPSALADGGYDVDDYRDVAPQIGTLEDFDTMVEALHEAGIRVMVDIVPNHSSNRHEWFRAALAGGPDAPERDLYHVRPGTGPDGVEPPNDWRSIFGGPAWERIEDRDAQGRSLTGPGTGRPYQWYLHIFAVQQPDLNWDHPAVREHFRGTLRFWADRGVDGFRIDAALGMAKDMSEPYRPFVQIPWWPLPEDGSHPLFDRDEVHEIYREWRTILEDYDPPRFAVAEAGVAASRRAAYAASVGQAFNFQMQDADFTPASYRWAVQAGLDDLERCGSTTWVLGCHDVIRVASRYGFDPREASAQDAGPAPAGQAGERDPRRGAPQEAGTSPHAQGTEDPGPYDPAQGEEPAGVSLALARRWVVANGVAPVGDAAAGRRRALAGALLVMALPGSMYLYQGDELGLPEVPDIPEDRLQDPIALRRRTVEKGRDGCRVPLPWTPAGSSWGFGPEDGAEPHLPQPPSWGSLSVQSQEGRAGSALELYRQGLALRRQVWGAANEEPLTWLETPDHVLAFARGDVQCWTAFGAPVELPAGRVLLSSAPIDAASQPAVLPADATAWLVP
ncbi:glycoside hydrolase family 13 protein, partial [Actinomyces bowdenii]|uniref:glycoside hydrolase family 13 protein n=1 Tax=Actinomyces bowdenii TaxID=131109 RepID=UPI001C54C881